MVEERIVHKISITILSEEEEMKSKLVEMQVMGIKEAKLRQ